MNAQSQLQIPYSEAMRRFQRSQPRVYRITVAGRLDSSWSDRLGGLQIEQLAGGPTDQAITVLQGLIKDQSLLSGILNTLSDQRLSLLSVELLDDDNQ